MCNCSNKKLVPRPRPTIRKATTQNRGTRVSTRRVVRRTAH